MSTAPLDMARDFYRDEIRDHVTYLTLAGSERSPALKATLTHIASMELRHSEFWKRFLTSRGATPPAFAMSRIKLRILRLLQRVLNSALLVSLLELGESNAFARYLDCLRTVPLDADERRELRAIILDEIEHEVAFRKESRRLGVDNIRDYILGMNDGLVELLGAVAGLSAVYGHNPFVVGVSGLVVGVAGAMSMGIGAFISVRSQREVNAGARERMEALFEIAPERAVAEYEERLAESGVPADTAKEVAARVAQNREAIAKLLLVEPKENELRSGLYTGIAYLAGVAFPVLPYFLATDAMVALGFSVALAAMALGTSAVVVSLLSGISLRRKAIEMITAGFVAAAIAYAIGALVRATIGVDL